MMYVVNMACGLANRMFQYSYYLYLKKVGYDVSVDYYETGKLAHESVEWNQICPKAYISQVSWREVLRLGGGGSVFAKLRRRYLPFTTRVKYMPTAFSVYLPEKDSKATYLFGVFQNAQMVNEVNEDVRKAFVFSPFEDEQNQTLTKEIAECESVSIHVRKGADYMERIWYQNTCSLSYYEKAIELMKKKVSSPKFYVFADNHEWVRENFKGFDYILVEGNPSVGWGSHFDMQLMSLCHHNIISNSTYSWWGAFLNESVNKIVVMPEVWFNPKSCDDYTSTKLMCEGWIAL